MTLIGVFEGSDVVMFADRQETLADVAKWDCDKIKYFEFFQRFRIAMSGAGDSNTADMIWEQVQAETKEFGFKYELPDMPKLKELILNIVSRITRKCILPYPGNDRPMVELIWAIQQLSPHESLAADPALKLTWPIDLFRTYGLAVNTISGKHFSGSPLPLIRYLYDMYLEGLIIGTEEAEALAVYLLWEAKEYDPYCGKHSDVITLRREGGVRKLSFDEVKYWENHFSHLKESMRLVPLLSCSTSPFTAQIYNPKDRIQRLLTTLRTLTSSQRKMRDSKKDMRTQLEKKLNTNLRKVAEKFSKKSTQKKETKLLP
jgi:hypothetical protein